MHRVPICGTRARDPYIVQGIIVCRHKSSVRSFQLSADDELNGASSGFLQIGKLISWSAIFVGYRAPAADSDRVLGDDDRRRQLLTLELVCGVLDFVEHQVNLSLIHIS